MGFAGPESPVDIMPYAVMSADELCQALNPTTMAAAIARAHIEQRATVLMTTEERRRLMEITPLGKAVLKASSSASITFRPGYRYGTPKSECPVHARGNKRDLRAVYYFRRFYNPFDSTEYQSKPERVTSGCVCGR